MAHPTSNVVVEFMTCCRVYDSGLSTGQERAWHILPVVLLSSLWHWSEYRTRACMAHPTSNVVVEFMTVV